MFAQSPPIRLLSKSARGRFAGIAWDFAATPDRDGDLILPSALKQAVVNHARRGTQPEIRIEHEPSLVAGAIDQMAVTDKGLEVEGQLDLGTRPGRVAFERLQSGEADGLSMGFNGALESSGRSKIYTEVDLVEISVCRYPMNAGARVSAVKSWKDVQSQIDLERLLRDHCGMTNRMAKKAATAAWPAIQSEDVELRSALARIINA